MNPIKNDFLYIGTSCTDVSAQVLQVNGLPDQEDGLHSPLPPPYSPLHRVENPSNLIFSFKLVGDNIDKDAKPRHMRLNHQTTLLHYFNTFAVQDRISTFNLLEQHTSHPSLSIHDFFAIQ